MFYLIMIYLLNWNKCYLEFVIKLNCIVDFWLKKKYDVYKKLKDNYIKVNRR